MAPGLLTFDQMKELYRGDEVDASTEVFGVIGDPIAHSMSPLVHNTAYRELGMNRVYLPMRSSENGSTEVPGQVRERGGFGVCR